MMYKLSVDEQSCLRTYKKKKWLCNLVSIRWSKINFQMEIIFLLFKILKVATTCSTFHPNKLKIYVFLS